MNAIIDMTIAANANPWIWPNKTISVILNSTADPPANGTFTTVPASKIVSYSQEYYQWRWNASTKTLYLMVKFPNQEPETHVELYGVSLPFSSGAKGSGKMVTTKPQHALNWGYRQKTITNVFSIPLKIFSRV